MTQSFNLFDNLTVLYVTLDEPSHFSILMDDVLSFISFTPDELKKIAAAAGCKFESSFILPDGDKVTD